MKFTETKIPGCINILPKVLEDSRGSFVKTFHVGDFAAHGLTIEMAEEFYSISKKNVLRGLHFQLPPHDHIKVVYCPSGKVLDVILDLRRGSPTFGQHDSIILSEELANILVIPSGIAHGFLTLSNQAMMVYKTSTVHAPSHDSGILWSSASIPWPIATPIISPRDSKLPTFADFQSPFRYVHTGD